MSEIVNIPLGGVSNEPNDYNAEEGGLSVSLNAVKHHGSIRPVLPGKDMSVGLPAGMDILAIHQVGSNKYYILQGKKTQEEAQSRNTPAYLTEYQDPPEGYDYEVNVFCTAKPPQYNETAGFIVDAEVYWTWVSRPPETNVELLFNLWGSTYNSKAGATCYIADRIGSYSIYDRSTFPIESGTFTISGLYLEGNLLIQWDDPIGDEPGRKVKFNIIDITPKQKFKISVTNYPNKVLINVQRTEGEFPWSGMRLEVGDNYASVNSRDTLGMLIKNLYLWRENEGGIKVKKKYDFENGTIVTQEDILPVQLWYMDAMFNQTDYKYFVDSNNNLTEYFGIEYSITSDEYTDEEGDGEDEDNNEDTEGEGQNEYVLYYHDPYKMENQTVEIATYATKVISATPIGNVLTLMRKNRPLEYLFWQEGRYHKVTGFKMPKIVPSLITNPTGPTGLLRKFGIDVWALINNANLSTGSDGLMSNKWWSDAKNRGTYVPFNAEQHHFVHNKVMSIINSVHSTISRKGYFYAPFFVRFALRMFDGTRIMHTPPQLMVTSIAGKPLLTLDIQDDGSTLLHPVFPVGELYVEIEKIEEDYHGLITHVDMYITPPVVNYTDTASALQGVCPLRLSNWNWNDKGSPKYQIHEEPYDDTTYRQGYQKSKHIMGNIYGDYNVDTNPSLYILMRKSNITCNKQYYVNGVSAETGLDKYQYETMYVLIQASAYPNIKMADTSGKVYTHQEILSTTKIGETKGGAEITLASTGIPTGAVYRGYKFNQEETVIFINETGESGTTFDAIFLAVLKPDYVGAAASGYMLDLKRVDGQDYYDVLINSNDFRLIHSWDIKSLANGYGSIVPIREGVLGNIYSHEILTDNGQLRRTYACNTPVFQYNNRISMVADTISLASTVSLAAMYNETVRTFINPGVSINTIKRAWVKAIKNGQTMYKELELGATDLCIELLSYFYYPENVATELILYTQGTGYKVTGYALKKHPFLDGAILWNNFSRATYTWQRIYETEEDVTTKDPDISAALRGEVTVKYGNLVRVSKEANPFYFSETNQVILPSGKISGLSTTAKALSQGQFGTFPLYCFSDNGIWALEVSDTGTYSAKQPVSRAVCTSPESITQTEGQVLFVTKRGLMALDGANVSCVSEVLSGHNYTASLKKLDEVLRLAGFEGVSLPDHIEEWMQDARFLYDDMRQYIYAFKSDDTLGYIYSISDQAWGMFVNDLEHPLPTYTDALAVSNPDSENKRRLINMSDYNQADHESSYKSLLITRPMTLGTADAYKTIEALVLRGMIDEDDAKLVIWASNDLKQWEVIASSSTSWYRGRSGTPYKYYRIGVLLDWEEEDSLNGMNADITTRLTNRIR